MSRVHFPFSSDQLELLLAFEESQGLAELAQRMAKDPSVVSRNLQRVAESGPVLAKVRNRWELTPLGQKINSRTREFLKGIATELAEQERKNQPTEAYESARALLVVINAQNGLLLPHSQQRNNSRAEQNIALLLKKWRTSGRPIAHIKHVSDNPDSLFYRHSLNADFLPLLEPLPDEFIIEKSKSSAFAATSLGSLLEKEEITTLVLSGFTANECIDATARSACDLGFNTFVVGDATAMFDVTDQNGKLLAAERMHQLILANLNALFAKVLETRQLI
jgi:nicotinamidase-related amidase